MNKLNRGDRGCARYRRFDLRAAVCQNARLQSHSNFELDDKLKEGRRTRRRHIINYKEKPDWAKEVRKDQQRYRRRPHHRSRGAGTLEQSVARCRMVEVVFIGILAGSSKELNLLPPISHAGTMRITGILLVYAGAFENMCRAVAANG